ncbi:trk system potassium uptake protein TrkH [Methanohalophilus levihalophilus]|uniref:TrkH family potassium uptake protein n=1 Tax=Methanohalophilus levihalophilus TaxID=1431282 RepID=UPI001FD9B486|nr:TrkH family potassium uptake protein [Methanohalophilus levihalophilus]MBP2029528.1 trk system potassium uptake protein TrkH [Methanohalophilus levihalophilus]
MIIAFVQLVPVVVAIIFSEYATAIFYGVTAIAAFIAGFTIYKLLPHYELETKEAIILVAIVFPLSSLISAVPMALSTGMPFIDAFFESVSAITTTGLSVAPADLGPVFLFSRSWSQWVGGIGILLIMLSILITPGINAAKIYKVYGGEKILPNVISTTRLLGRIYVGITLIAIIILLLGGMTFFDAVCHAFSSVSTGGFSTHPESIAAFQGPLIPLMITISCIMGAISFAIYPKMIKNPKVLIENLEVRYFLLVIAVGTVALAYSISREPETNMHLSDILFQVVSALTTAGFSTTDLSVLSDASKGLMSGLMCIGGGIGSTAGGVKIFRLIVLVKLIKIVIARYFLPKETITPLMVKDHVVENEELKQLTVFVLLYAIVLIISAYIFMLNGVGAGDAIFEVSSALGTVGLSAGVTDASMPAILKVILCTDMLLGRIEIIPLLILAMPRTWIKI